MNTILKGALFSIGILLVMAAFSLGAVTEPKADEPKTIELSVPEREIYLLGPIDEGMAYYIGQQLKALNKSGSTEITMHITSPGGSVYAGLKIYDQMRESASPIKTVCEGHCMSMAAFLLAVGDTRLSSEHATIMFHELSMGAEGKLAVVQNGVAEAKRLQDTMDSILSKRSQMPVDVIERLIDHDDFMTAEDAKSFNLIDSIVPQR